MGAVSAMDSKMLHSALLGIVRVSRSETGHKASGGEIKEPAQNPRNFHIFLHSLTSAACAANEENGIYVLESMV